MNHGLKCRSKKYKTFTPQKKNLWDVRLQLTPKIQSIKEKLANEDFIKIKNFCSTKDPIKKIKREATNWEKRFTNQIPSRRLVSRLYIRHSQNPTVNSVAVPLKVRHHYHTAQQLRSQGRKTHVHTKPCAWVISTASLRKAGAFKKPDCSSTDEWMYD